MKTKKLLLQVTICILVFFLSFEQLPVYLDEINFNSNRIKIESTEDMSAEEIANYIIYKADNRYGVFIDFTTSRSEFESAMVIYTDYQTKKLLEKEQCLLPGKYKSVLGESIKLSYDTLENFSSDNNIAFISFYDESAESVTFIRDIVKELTEIGAKVEFDAGVKSNNSKQTIRNAWIIAMILTFFLSLFDAVLQKKEVTVRIVNGESVTRIFLKNIFVDILGVSLINTAIFFAFKLIYSNYPFAKLTLLMIAILIIVDIIPYIIFFKINIRKDLSSYKNVNLIMVSSYSLKTLSLFISLILIILSMSTIQKALDFKRGSALYADSKDSNFLMIVPDEIAGEDIFLGLDVACNVQNQIYLDYFEKAKPVMLSRDGDFGENNCIVFANVNAQKYLKKALPNIEFSDDVLILVPNELKNMPNINMLSENYQTELGFKENVVYYTQNLTLSTLNDTFDSNEIKEQNPIIVYWGIGAKEWGSVFEKNNRVLMNCFRSISFSFDENIASELKSKYDLTTKEIVLTDFSKQYEAQNENAVISAVVCTVMLAMTLLFVLQIEKMFLTVKFAVSGKEYAIKRVNGKSNFQLYYKMGIAEVISFVVSVTFAVWLVHSNAIGIPIRYEIIGAGILLIVNDSFFIIELKRSCVDNAMKMIKGGIL